MGSSPTRASYRVGPLIILAFWRTKLRSHDGQLCALVLLGSKAASFKVRLNMSERLGTRSRAATTLDARPKKKVPLKRASGLKG